LSPKTIGTVAGDAGQRLSAAAAEAARNEPAAKRATSREVSDNESIRFGEWFLEICIGLSRFYVDESLTLLEAEGKSLRWVLGEPPVESSKCE
jgi:hypothetical protein